MNKIVKWLCHVFIMTVYSVSVCQCKKSQILVTLPENNQDSPINYLHSHLKTTVNFHITVFSEVQDTEYVCFTFLLHSLCNSNLFKTLCKRKNTPLSTTNINSLWVDRRTTGNNITVHIGTEQHTYTVNHSCTSLLISES